MKKRNIHNMYIKKGRPKVMKYVNLGHVFTQEEGEIRLHVSLSDDDWVRAYLDCPAPLVQEVLKTIDLAAGCSSLSKAVNKKLKSSTPPITISISKVTDRSGLIGIELKNAFIVQELIDEDEEFEDDYEIARIFEIKSVIKK